MAAPGKSPVPIYRGDPLAAGSTRVGVRQARKASATAGRQVWYVQLLGRMTMKWSARRAMCRSLILGAGVLVAAMGGGCGRVGLDPSGGLGASSVAEGTGGAPRGTGGARGTGGTGIGGAGAGVGGESGSCSGLGATDCQARHGCAYYVCNCRGTGICTTPQPTPPACDCPLNCPSLDETTCRSRSPICRTDYCPTCGGAQTFAGCAFADAPPPMCVAPPCPPLSCAQETTRDACDRRTDCHSVLFDGSTLCKCASPDCCISFVACADGGKAVCTTGQPLMCTKVAPYCGPGYTVSYVDRCYEGCVAAKECDPLPGG
jgi:hypothetical protein